MLNLLNVLTKEDKEKIEKYVTNIAVEKKNFIGVDKYLTHWATEKKRMFHLLDGNLVYKKKVKIEKNAESMRREIERLVAPYHNRFGSILNTLIFDVHPSSRIPDFFCQYNTYLQNKTPDDIHLKNESGKELKIQKGAKAVKALIKVMNFLGYDKMYQKELEEFRIDMSMVLNDKYLEGNLCFSIHPIDFMTMSDNDSGWQSCMSWVHNGCYREGTVEMMNSNNVIVCYLESRKPYTLTDVYTQQPYELSNKKWRVLCYCTDDIIMTGKAYPYQSEALCKECLCTLRELAKKNLHKTYEYGPELYKDMIHIDAYGKMQRNREWLHERDNEKTGNILFDTQAMYNDMLNCSDRQPFYCIRNKVTRKKIISVSGKCNCLSCNADTRTINFDFEDEYYEDQYNERYINTNALLCSDCVNKSQWCEWCSKPAPILTKVHYGDDMHYICKECFQDSYRHCPFCGELTNINDYRTVLFYSDLADASRRLYGRNPESRSFFLPMCCKCINSKTLSVIVKAPDNYELKFWEPSYQKVNAIQLPSEEELKKYYEKYGIYPSFQTWDYAKFVPVFDRN